MEKAALYATTRVNSNMDRYGILQWNVQVVRNKKDEILDLIEIYKLNIIAVQESKLSEGVNFRISNYNIVRRDGTFNHTHEGVATLIHASIPYEAAVLNTPMQAIAVRVRLHKVITICNIYSLRSQVLNCQLLEDIHRQLPKPVIILGDFNAYKFMWVVGHDGCKRERN